MSIAPVSDDLKQSPFPPAILSVLDLWQAVTEARSLPDAAVTLAHLAATLSGCDSASLLLGPTKSQSYTWPQTWRLTRDLRAEPPPNTAGTGPHILTPPIGFSLQDGKAESWIPGAAIVLSLASGQETTGQAPLCWRRAPETLPGAECLRAIGRYAAQGLRDTMRWQAAQRRERYLTLGFDVISVISRARTLTELLEAVLGHMLHGLGHGAGAIYLVGAEPAHLVLGAATGDAPSGWPAAGSGWPRTLPDAAGWMPCEFPPATTAPRLSSAEQPWSAIPLASSDHTRGLIFLAGSHHHETPDVIGQVLRVLGFLLGMATEHLRTREALEGALLERNTRWAALYEMSEALSFSLDSGSLLDEIVRRSVQLLDARGGALTLRDEANDDLVITVIQGLHLPIAELIGRRLKLGEGISRQAIQSRRPVILDSYAAWPHSISGLTEKIMDAVVAVPLISDGRAIGALMVTDNTPGRRFTEDDVQTLSLFALQAALVLEGARRHEQAGQIALHAERARLTRDLHDGLAQDLAALLLRADACQALLGTGNAALWGRLEALSVGLQWAIRDARATIFALRSDDLEGLEGCSLEDGLRAEAIRFEAQTRVPVGFALIGADCQQLSRERELALLRLAQEALTNIRKHAQAKQVQVQLTWLDAEQVQLCVSDDGRGFDPRSSARVQGEAGQHLGLALMQERMAALGGTVAVKSKVGEGTTVCAMLPVRRRGYG